MNERGIFSGNPMPDSPAPDTRYRTKRTSTRTPLWCRCTSESRNDDLVRSLHDGDDGLALVTDLHAMRGGDEYGGQ